MWTWLKLFDLNRNASSILSILFRLRIPFELMFESGGLSRVYSVFQFQLFKEWRNLSRFHRSPFKVPSEYLNGKSLNVSWMKEPSTKIRMTMILQFMDCSFFLSSWMNILHRTVFLARIRIEFLQDSQTELSHGANHYVFSMILHLICCRC